MFPRMWVQRSEAEDPEWWTMEQVFQALSPLIREQAGQDFNKSLKSMSMMSMDVAENSDI